MNFDRDQVLDALTANCESAQDAAALNELSDGALQAILNAKAPGSGADLTPGSDEPVRLGGIDGKVKDENDEDWSLKTKTAAGKKAPNSAVSTPAMNEDDEDEDEGGGDGMARNRKRLMSFDELLNNVDLETRETLLLGRETARREKRALVMNLLAHVEDDATRNRLGSQLFKLDKAQLEERLLLLPPTDNRGRREPSYAGRGGAMVENFGLEARNGAPDVDDVLPILTLNDVPDPHATKKTRTA